MVDQESTVRQAFVDQADWCERLGSPFMSRLMRVLARVLDAGTGTGRAVLNWPGRVDASGDAVPLRLGGALNALARSGHDPALSFVWPPGAAPGTAAGTGFGADAVADAELEQAVSDALLTHDTLLQAWLKSPPQTNEVGRAAVVYPALMQVAVETGLPLSLFELGSSAGLVQLLDRYRYVLGGRVCGAPESTLTLSPRWEGAAPQGIDPVIVSRRGCDRSPVNIAEPAERDRLLAYVWPDQSERIARLEAALAIAADLPPRVDAMDAADWIELHLPVDEASGVARVLFHTIARQYFSAEVEARVADRVAACGRAATVDAPFAAVAFEQDDLGGPALDLTLWPGGNRRRLARAHAHGSQVSWNH